MATVMGGVGYGLYFVAKVIHLMNQVNIYNVLMIATEIYLSDDRPPHSAAVGAR